jgi:nucleoid DNA-binding protein
MPEVDSFINKSDIIKAMSKKMNMHEADTAFIVDILSRKITEVLTLGHRIEFRCFGRFEVRLRNAYGARNPKNGDKISTLEKNKVHFKASTQLLARIKDSLTETETEI